jgi:phosphoribosyl 1,2-cyclic phosphodiesterase
LARIYPLFSSSKGNCTYIGSSGGGILIDCGVSFARLEKALRMCSIPSCAVRAVFVTHEHSDHIKGIAMLTKKLPVKVFASGSTLSYMLNGGIIKGDYEEFSGETKICGMTVRSFPTSHDTPDSCGYSITFEDEKRCCVCTDLGYVSDTVEENLLGADAVLLEANYDVEMLRNGSYPYYLKERIFSGTGHLSNDDCGKLAAKLIKSGTTRFILGHLSEENNTPAAAEETVMGYLDGYTRNKDYILSVAPRETSGGFVSF